MPFFKKYPKFIKFTLTCTLGCGTGWCYYQVKKTQDILSNALDTSALSQLDIRNDPDNFLIIPVSRNLGDEDLTIPKLWRSLKFEFAKRLVVLASNENKFIRTKAVRQLAKINSLEYWHFDLLSSMIDPRTAVGLARTGNADQRFFSHPPLNYFAYSQNMLVEVMKELLVHLHERSQHPCMGYFISKAFVDLHDIWRFSDHDTVPVELKKHIQSSHEVLPLCLETLLHHASLENYSKDIADLNGLPLLMEIYRRFKGNIEVSAMICRIISYLSMDFDLLEDLYKSGWIGILAEWMRDEDIRISIPAAKALANLDREEDPVYLQRLYPLHPVTRSLHKAEVDVVFIHGLLGGVFYTWRQRNKEQDPLGLLESISKDTCLLPSTVKKLKNPISSDPNVQEYIENLEEQMSHQCECKDYDVVWEDLPTKTNKEAEGPFTCPGQDYFHHCKEDGCYTNCWPKDWLAEDCNNLRIIGVNYETNLSMWAPLCPVEKVKTLDERSDELIYQFNKIGLGKRPILWVTHSMGGLVVKNILCKAFQSRNNVVKDLYLNTRGIVFYSTPHAGSSVAKLSQASALVVWPTVEVQELQQNSPKLLEIHEKFLEISEKAPIKVVTFIETQPTVVTAMKFKFLIVEPSSGNPGIGEYYEVPLDHLGICKPASRHSFLYQKVLHLLTDIINENKKVVSKK